MSIFSDYLKDKPEEERAAFERIISLVKKHVPDAEEGLSYGFPAFRLSNIVENRSSVLGRTSTD